jgi:hypothetical protein
LIETRNKKKDRAFRSMVLLAACVTLSGCGKIKGSITHLIGDKVIDFEKTEILSNGSVPADGSSELIVVIHLKNSDLSVVPNYRPMYQIEVGSGVVSSDCGLSDINGIAVCVLRSTVSGFKKFVLTNAKKGLSKDVEFTAQGKKPMINLVSGAQLNGTTSQGDKARITLGEKSGVLHFKTSDGYHMRFGLAGQTAGK